MKSSSKLVESHEHIIPVKEFMEKFNIKGDSDTLRVHRGLDSMNVIVEIDERKK